MASALGLRRIWLVFRQGYLLLGSLTLVLSAVGPAPVSASQEHDEIRAALEQWTTDFNAGRADRVCALFAPDLIASYQGQPESDFDTLCARLRQSLSDPTVAYRYDLAIQEILVSGDLAVVRLVWTLTVRRNGGSAEERIVEPGMDVFRREAEGTWRIFRYLAYPASPG